MLAYVTMHLANHAMGLVSLGAMERMLVRVSGLWSFPPMQLLLYGSFVTHYALGLMALWQRRTLRLSLGELCRLVLGLAIPFLLLRHVTATRLAHAVFGTDTSHYTYLLWVYFVHSPATGYQQMVVLVVAWMHGMLGLHFWLRIRRRYVRLQSLALVFAALFPVLSLLGVIEIGRRVAVRAAEAGWTESAFASMTLPTTEIGQSLDAIVEVGTCFFLTTIAAVLGGRLLRGLWPRRHGLVRISYPDGRYIEVARGTSVLEASRLAGVPHASICGGRGRCSTCRVRVRSAADATDPAGDDEGRVLRRIRATPNVRLACMLRPRGPVEVTPLLAPFAVAEDGLRPIDIALGSERVVAILFADIRGFTSLSENRLPYDVVFILNRYFAAVGRAVETAGGRIDKFVGDGIMALFGIDNGPEQGCRQALLAARTMSERLLELNAVLASDIEAPLRIGIGIHVGPAIIGEIGYRSAKQLTAIGDAVNIASRLEDLAKSHDVELMFSDETAARAGFDLSAFPMQAVEIRGRQDTLAVRMATHAADLAPIDGAANVAGQPATARSHSSR